MKTAIIISGHARTFQWMFSNQQAKLFSKLPNPHFFVSVVQDAHSAAMELLRAHFPQVQIEYVPGQPDCVEIIGQRLFGPEAPRPAVDAWFKERSQVGTYRLAPHAKPQTVFGSLWHQQRAFRLAGGGYDLYVRHRPDLNFIHLDVPIPEADELYVPWWSSWGGINDRFGIMGAKAAEAYFNQFDQLAPMLKDGVPLHPETLSGEAVRRGQARVRPLNVNFSAIRPPDAAGNFAEVRADYSVTDIFHLVKAMQAS